MRVFKSGLQQFVIPPKTLPNVYEIQNKSNTIKILFDFQA